MKHQFDSPKTFGPYELLERIGRGATATVYKARRQSDDRVVALKMGARLLSVAEASFARFKREFTIIRNIRHPNLVEALDFGEVNHVPYVILEYVCGATLEEKLRQCGPMPLTMAAPIILQIAEGLRLIHHKGFLHRDIKPGNILITAQGCAKLGDFGLLKSLASDSCMTSSGQAMGTIEFGAPEQFENAKDTDFRCDVYSLAATFYCIVTCSFPFGKGGVRRIQQRKKKNQFVPLRLIRPDLPPELDDLISRSINADRQKRPSLDEFITCLSRHAFSHRKIDTAPAEQVALPNGGAERRKEVRLSVSLPATIVPFHQNSRRALDATIIDFSAGGLCLKTVVPVQVKSIVEVTTSETGASYIAEVRWVSVSEKEQIVGCAFACTPHPKELDAITPTICKKAAI